MSNQPPPPPPPDNQPPPPPPDGTVATEPGETDKPWFKKPIGIIGIVVGVFLLLVIFGALAGEGPDTADEAADEEVDAIEVPELVGASLDDARDQLDELGLEVEEVDADEDRAIFNPANWEVESQDPASGETLEAGGTVTLTVFRPEDREEAAEPEEDEEADEFEESDDSDEPDDGDDTDWAEVYDPMAVDADTFVERWNDAIEQIGAGYMINDPVWAEDLYLNEFPSDRQTFDDWGEIYITDHVDPGLLQVEIIATAETEEQGIDLIVMMYALIHGVTDMTIEESVDFAEDELALTEDQIDPDEFFEEATYDGVIFEVDAFAGSWSMYAAQDHFADDES